MEKTTETGPEIQKRKIDPLLIIVIVLLFISLCVLGFLVYKINLQKQNITTQKEAVDNTVTYNEPSSLPTTSSWVLNNTAKGKTETIATFCGSQSCYGNYIVQWKDWIFYSTPVTDNIQVLAYNLKSGEQKLIFDQQGLGLGEKFQPTSLSDIQILKDTLYFSTGGYMAGGTVYWVDLPPAGKPEKLTESFNPRIRFLKDHYWIIGSEGDACVGLQDYSLVDLDSKEVTHIASSSSGCTVGEEFVGIDNKDRMIMAFHDADQSKNQDEVSGPYLYVNAIPLTSPSEKVEVIAAKDMPSDVFSVKYLEGKDQLLLSGAKKYLYDLSSNNLSQTDISIPDSTSVFTSFFSSVSFEDQIKSLDLPSDYGLVQE